MITLISKMFTRIFGSRNERLIKSYVRRVEQINRWEDAVCKLTDTELKAQTDAFIDRLGNGERMGQILPEALAVAREVMDRAVGIRNIFNPEHGFDSQQLPSDLRPTYARILEQMKVAKPIQVSGGAEPVSGWLQLDVPVEIYGAVRELFPDSRPPFRARPFDVQLVGGMVLSEGNIAEMKTGEGKTIVAPLACYLAALQGLYCYVVTVNDYLVQRDRDWVFPFFHHLGLTVGAIHPIHMQPPDQKMAAYGCNVVYGTNSEFGFDFLRDNMHLSVAEQVQKHRDFCIVDEVDSILIDEARTPLIISGPAHEDAPRYGLADSIARHLMQQQREWDRADDKAKQCAMRVKGLEGDIRNTRDKKKAASMREEMDRLAAQLPDLEADRDRHIQYYEVEMEKKAAHLLHEGVAEAQKKADIGSFYVGNNMDFPHLLENGLRAHVVYQRDKDYVVQDGEVIIVDEFTGRLMIGRQWSDGLHQSIESKERVKIKEETQTLATVTIQNYFKLFKRLAGMTGTAITEATEFNEIYGLDVACIPTNVSVVRDDRPDVVYMSQKDKWHAVLAEIKQLNDVGRPVLVGTTSVEASEALSEKLTRGFSIQHEILNAKQHEREAHIVANAGGLGAVMIATNMAGRGTDIRLQPIDRAELVRHWQQRNILPRRAEPSQSDEQLIELTCRHMATQALDLKEADVEKMTAEEVRLNLLRHWAESEAWVEHDKAAIMSGTQCEEALDKVFGFVLHRLRVFQRTEEMGGLHIVGTERHESRRIDNQLRGRSGRQGDQGSSRFYVALEDDLMKLFAGPKVLAILSKLGMKEGDALESRLVSKRLEGAQRKVEERNYEIRKNLLEYDEVMELQRNRFYGIRQSVLEGQKIDTIIFDYIGDAIDDACDTYLDGDYVSTQVAEWCRQNMAVSIDPGKLRTDDLPNLQKEVKIEARAEAHQDIEITLGEYMSKDLSPESWDLRSLSSWAMSRFSVDLKQNQLRQMNLDEVTERLSEAAHEQIERKDLSGLAKFLDSLYAQSDLAEWVNQKFDIQLASQLLAPKSGEKPPDTKQRVAEVICEKAVDTYREREIRYPIEFAMEMVTQTAQHDQKRAAQQLVEWANQRYDMGWSIEQVADKPSRQIYDDLLHAAGQWHRNGKMDALVDRAMHEHGADLKALGHWIRQRLGQEADVRQWQEMDRDALRSVLVAKGRAMLRQELAQLERFVLLQILDMAWKDHLYAMDQLKDSVGLRGYAEKDPRIEYKREGANQFLQMQKTVRNRVTELIFRARLTPNMEARSVYGPQHAEHAEAGSVVDRAAHASVAGTAEQQQDLQAAQQTGGKSSRPMSRRARRASAGKGTEADEASSPHQSKTPYKRRKRRRR